MGWAGGSEIAGDVWTLIRKKLPKEDRKKTARKIIKIFLDQDCDTLQECEQLLKDAEVESPWELR